jgi:hypothetical protein
MSHLESLMKYHTLASNSHADPELLGCALPHLQPGHIEAQQQSCNPSELSAFLSQWQHAQGWYQSRDQVGLGMPAHTADLIEGQWFQAEQSLHLVMSGENTYQITLLIEHQVAPGQVATQCYSEQKIMLRPDLKDHNDVLSYRLWWQQAKTGQDQASWRPLLQQFCGLAQLEEQ